MITLLRPVNALAAPSVLLAWTQTAQRESVSEAGVPKLTEPFPKIATANAIQEAT